MKMFFEWNILQEGYGNSALDKFHDKALDLYKSDWQNMVANDIAPNISWGAGIKAGKPLICGLNWGYKHSIQSHHSQLIRNGDESNAEYEARANAYIDSWSSKHSAHRKEGGFSPFDKRNPAFDFKFQKNFFKYLENLDLLKSTNTSPKSWGQMQLIPLRSKNDAHLKTAGGAAMEIKKKALKEWVPEIIKDLSPPVVVVSYSGFDLSSGKWGAEKIDFQFSSTRDLPNHKKGTVSQVMGINVFSMGSTLLIQVPHASQHAYRINSDLPNYFEPTREDAKKLATLLKKQ